ncbi:Protein kinase superfamily protein [Rhynchospora pubera]|uniref:non-specific serine/threonine protein kinase n=1 Tax=Rhynchospora pubera TaxID=906938 RepID=A0AAV8FJF9_9POAL|nr:Protein kinase superfamily protein [Rhynchospora pubera]
MGNCCAARSSKKRHGNSQSPTSPNKNRKSTSSSRKISKVESEISSQASTVPVIPKDIEDLRLMAGYGHVHIFTYNELYTATKGFRPDLVIGEGGFGFVYKGVIDESVRPGFPETHVAVKELNTDSLQGDKEWMTEVSFLGQVTHRNLVKLVGYCCENEHRLLVYEYMASGSLDKHLFSRMFPAPQWSTRMRIALDAARGIAFLHAAERPLIYRDLKTSNILLDEEFNAKISDFGLAKEGPTGEKTHVSTRVMGTYGYCSPEYLNTGHLSTRSDVYSFGVLLLEILIGRRALDKSRPEREQNLVDWGRPLLIRPAKLVRVIDPRLEGQFSRSCAEMLGKLTYDCLDCNPKARPTMDQVVQTLETIVNSGKDDIQIGESNHPVTTYEFKDESGDASSKR